jgi:hypothetical protein
MVDRLQCVRFASARCSVAVRLIGSRVRLRIDDGRLLAIMPATRVVVSEHVLVAPGDRSALGVRTQLGCPDALRSRLRTLAHHNLAEALERQAGWVLSGSVGVGRDAPCRPISAPPSTDAHKLLVWPH